MTPWPYQSNGLQSAAFLLGGNLHPVAGNRFPPMSFRSRTEAALGNARHRGGA